MKRRALSRKGTGVVFGGGMGTMFALGKYHIIFGAHGVNWGRLK